MKHLKSSASDLRLLMDDALTVTYLGEPLVSFDDDKPAAVVREFMTANDFDAVGVRSGGLLAGYCRREDLVSGTLGVHLVPFNATGRSGESTVLPDSASLLDAMSCLKMARFVFVAAAGHVFSIVARGDLHKAPVRMWLFGLVTLIEMQLLRLVRKHHPEESWSRCLSADRLQSAATLLAERRRRNEAIDLADCLQFCDKAGIFRETGTLRSAAGFASKSQCRDFFKQIETLRNELSHAQDFSAGNWPAMISLAERAEQFLREIEKR